jgi:hypothetical protein
MARRLPSNAYKRFSRGGPPERVGFDNVAGNHRQLGTQCPQCQYPHRLCQWCRCQPQPQPSATSSIGGVASAEALPLGSLGKGRPFLVLYPADNECSADDCRPEHCAQGTKRLTPARWEVGELALHEIQLVHNLSEVVARLGSLTKGEALGV